MMKRFGVLLILILVQMPVANAAQRRIACRSFVDSKLRDQARCAHSTRQMTELRNQLLDYCVSQMNLFGTPAFNSVTTEKVSAQLDLRIKGAKCSVVAVRQRVTPALVEASPQPVSTPASNQDDINDSAAAAQ